MKCVIFDEGQFLLLKCENCGLLPEYVSCLVSNFGLYIYMYNFSSEKFQILMAEFWKISQYCMQYEFGFSRCKIACIKENISKLKFRVNRDF